MTTSRIRVPRRLIGAHAFAIALVACSLGACSPSAYEVHGIAATGLRDLANVAHDTLREEHRQRLEAARDAVVRQDGEPEASFLARRDNAIDEASAAWRAERVDLIDAQHVAASTTNAYSASALAGYQGQGDSLPVLAGIGGEALGSIDALIRVFRRGPFPDFPGVPDVIRSLLLSQGD